MGKSILLGLAPPYVAYYTRIAQQYLEGKGINLVIAELEPGELAVRVCKPDGTSDWFRTDPEPTSAVLTWESQAEADDGMQNYVLPNIGYRVVKRRILKFYNLLEELKK